MLGDKLDGGSKSTEILIVLFSQVKSFNLVEGLLNGFASGALLASVAFLMVIESTHLVAAGWPGGGEEVARFSSVCPQLTPRTPLSYFA